VRLTEESEHASARLHLYCCSWRDKDDGWMDAEAQLLLRAHFSFCQLSLLLETFPPYASIAPSHLHPSLRADDASSSSCRSSRSPSHIGRRGGTVCSEAPAGLFVSLPETLSCLPLGFRWPMLFGIRYSWKPVNACTPWILALTTFLFFYRWWGSRCHLCVFGRWNFSRLQPWCKGRVMIWLT